MSEQTSIPSPAPTGRRRGRRGADLVGRAFRGHDGVVRWFTGLTPSGLLRTLWLSEDDQTWFNGGNYSVKDWPGGEEVPAPAVGSRVRKASVLGLIEESEVRA